MTKHIAYEYDVALLARRRSLRALMPKLSQTELVQVKKYADIDIVHEFYKSLKKVDSLKMYDRFRKDGWTRQLSSETANILLPEIVKIITFAWLSALPKEDIHYVKTPETH